MAAVFLFCNRCNVYQALNNVKCAIHVYIHTPNTSAANTNIRTKPSGGLQARIEIKQCGKFLYPQAHCWGLAIYTHLPLIGAPGRKRENKKI